MSAQLCRGDVRKVPDVRNTADNGNKCPMLNENHCALHILYIQKHKTRFPIICKIV